MHIDWLYRLTARDEQVTPLELTYQTRNSTLAASPLQFTMVVPQNRVLLLYHIHAVADPASATNVTLLQVVLQDESGRFVMEFINDSESVGENEFRTGQYSGFPIAPLHRFFALASFDAVVNPNSLSLSIGGVLVPRGNFSLGGPLLTP